MYNADMELLKMLHLLSDPGRVRVLRLLSLEELSVAELQEILDMGQSRISMQLSQMRQAGLVEVRRAGQKSLYRLTVPAGLSEILAEVVRRSALEVPEAACDDAGLNLVLRHRKDRLRAHFDELAGRFGRSYVPGRSWQALAEMLIKLLPPLVVADLGAGEATLAMLLAQSAERVIAVDNSERMVEYGAELARKNGVANLEYRLGDLEDLPIDTEAVDLALLHQTLHHALHPARAVLEAFRILRPGGRITVVDLLKHDFEPARDLYADVWLGFSQVEMQEMLTRAGFVDVDVAIVHREEEAPHFVTVLGTGVKGKKQDKPRV